jgi:hypothetical protein
MTLHSKGKKHNKKRNTGLVYEFLIRQMVEGILRDDTSHADRALSIIKRRFKQGTQLYREWRLMNALAKTSNVDESIANAILRETRDAVRKYDRVKLDREKSALIQEVNHTFGKDTYDRGVPQYKTYATIQTLFDDWRCTGIPNVHRIAEYELKLRSQLITESRDVLQGQPDPEADALVVKLMIEKLNRNYANKLSPLQRTILGRYTFEGITDSLRSDLTKLKTETLDKLKKYGQNVKESDKFTLSKLSDVQSVIESIDVNNLDDVTLPRFMKLCELKEELDK